MTEARSSQKLCQIAENLMDFDFKTPEALAFKQELRWWYYGARDREQGRHLLNRFDHFFSGNMLFDVAGDLLRAVGEQSPLELTDSQRETLSRIAGGEIVGKSVRAYGITENGIQYQFPQWKKRAADLFAGALKTLEEQLRRERGWRKENRVSLFTALVSLAGIAALVNGVILLLPLVWQALQRWSVEETVMGLPLWGYAGSSVTLACIGLMAAAVLNLSILLRGMAMSLGAGLFWTFYQRGRLRRRTRLTEKFRLAMTAEGFDGYYQKLEAAADQLRQQPWDTPRNRDPSRELLGRAGLDKVFQTYPLRPLSRCLDAKRFFQLVEARHVRSPLWIVFLCAGLVFLQILLWNPGMIL